MHRTSTHKVKSIVLAAAMLLAVAAVFPGGAAAVGTPAGTSISNQASVSYQDAASNNFTAVSNSTSVTVTAVYSVAITTPPDASGLRNATVYYPYTLTNTGNASNTFALSTTSPGWTIVLYADDGFGGGIANDGIHQAGETNVTASTGALIDNATYQFIMAVTVPAGAADGATETTTLNVVGSGIPGPGNADDISDTVITTAQAPILSVAKDVRNVTTSGSFTGLGTANAVPNDILEYQITATNSGSVVASSVVLSDPVNSNTGFVLTTASFIPDSSGLTGATIEFSTNGGASWVLETGLVDQGCGAPVGSNYCVTNIRWTAAGTMASGGSSFNALFRVRVK